MYGKEGGYSFLAPCFFHGVSSLKRCVTHAFVSPYQVINTIIQALYSHTENKMWHYLFILFHHVLFGQKS